MAHKEWRRFEQLVRRIEELACPRGAIVKSPDHVQDLITGHMREVDASIRYAVGTADVLITVECRKRSRRADDTWIEQLATKRSKIGAAKTIAVSSSGFSQAAIETAKRHGIEVRTLTEVSDADIEGWFTGGPLIVIQTVIPLPPLLTSWIMEHFADEPVVVVSVSIGKPSVLALGREGEGDELLLQFGNLLEPLLYCPYWESPFPPFLFFDLMTRTHPHLFADMPFDGTTERVALDMGCGPGEMRCGDIPIHRIVVSADCQWRVEPAKNAAHAQYEKPTGESIQHSVYITETSGVFHLQSGGDSEGLQASVEFSADRPAIPLDPRQVLRPDHDSGD